MDFLPKVELEVVVADDQAGKIVDAIAAAVRSGEIGDGNVFVASVDLAVRIRNGEQGECIL